MEAYSNRRRGMCVAAVCIFSLLSGAAASGATDNSRLTAEFQQRVKQYLDLRKKAAGQAPKPTDSPQVIASSQRDLGNKVRVMRAGAKQGEIFAPEIAQYFRRQLTAALAGQSGKKVRASLHRAEPVKMDMQINQSYPENVPLQSMPPSLLLKLPELPDGLEYRILDRELVLRDTEANIVVDYIPEALPDTEK
ncbi:MAG: hypothetical protein DMG97_42205 [Acidobacteria bacterium]|nr:MAG: hypothetical protein DMG97_42205 [Acidobacteriota bacterium]